MYIYMQLYTDYEGSMKYKYWEGKREKVGERILPRTKMSLLHMLN